MSRRQWRVGVDVGGTFTDLALLDQTSRDMRVLKVPTTPGNPADGVLNGLDAAVRRFDDFHIAEVGDFLHGTTITTNALIQRTFSPCALLVTEGVKGSAMIQDQRRTGSIYDLRAGHPESLVAFEHIYEVPGRISADGAEVEPVDVTRLSDTVRRIRRAGIETVAVCLLFSFANPAHEQRVREELRAIDPDLRVRTSSDVLPRIREWPRMSTVLLGCSLEPLLIDYVNDLADGLVAKGLDYRRLFLMESNGGLMPFSAVTSSGRAVHTLLSGPAAGVQAAIRMAGGSGRDSLVTMDVGGTSADIAFVQDGQALEVTEGELVGHHVYVPMLDLGTVGAGGGTLCRGSEHGRLLVGPNSAGADPGPACYAKGGDVSTVTDANLVLGLLDPEYYLGGRLTLDLDAARRAVDTHLARPLGLGRAAAAHAAAHLNEVHMADAIKVMAAQRGVDLTDTTLVACGGAGPLHACGVADELGIGSVLVPAHPGAFSAVGLLGSDVIQDFVQTAITALAAENETEIEKQFGALEERARQSLVEQGFPVTGIEMRREADSRYAGQGFELRLPVPPREDHGRHTSPLAAHLTGLFHREHQRIYGHAATQELVEIVSYRVRAVVRMPKPETGPNSADAAGSAGGRSERKVFHGGTWGTVRTANRATLSVGDVERGPLVVEQSDTTTWVPPGWTLEVDSAAQLILTKEPAQ